MQIRTGCQLGLNNNKTTTRCEQQPKHNDELHNIQLLHNKGEMKHNEQKTKMMDMPILLCYKEDVNWMNPILPRGKQIAPLVQRWECQTYNP
jgi:hypothetical protein